MGLLSTPQQLLASLSLVSLSEFERKLVVERTTAGLASAIAHG